MLTDFVGTNPLLLPWILAWTGIAAAAVLGVLGAVMLQKAGRRIKGGINLAAAVFAVLFYLWMLFGTEEGVICCRPVWQTVLLYGWVLLPLIGFLWDSIRILLMGRKK